MIRLRCSSCGKMLNVADAHAGKVGACPHCKSKVQVPSLEDVATDVVEEEPEAPPPARSERVQSSPASKRRREEEEDTRTWKSSRTMSRRRKRLHAVANESPTRRTTRTGGLPEEGVPR